MPKEQNWLIYTEMKFLGGMVDRYNPEIKKDRKLLKKGFMALQSEGQPIDFRRIKIRNLKGCMNPKAVNYGNHFIKSDTGSCIYK